MPQKIKSFANESRIRKHRTGIPDEGNRCTHTDALGRQCRALAVPLPGFREAGSKFGLCPTHAVADRQIQQADAVAKHLLENTPHFDTATGVNYFLEKLVEMVVNNRIPVRNATVLGYLASLLLNSLGRVKDEMFAMGDCRRWNEKVFMAATAINPHSFDDILESVRKELEASGKIPRID
ncbi:MAG TPA: hypothetical protein VLV89_05005 [Candidatus Acidoferrum sp.]|nr:hypothetical protein [Candidatus Acidoferrum sp.]